MKGRQGFLQGYNGQAMATVDLVVIAAELSMNPIDRNELVPMIETANETLEAANVDAKIGVVVADAGYWSQHNATAQVDCELLIATTTADKQAQGPQPEVAARIAADDQESMPSTVPSSIAVSRSLSGETAVRSPRSRRAASWVSPSAVPTRCWPVSGPRVVPG